MVRGLGLGQRVEPLHAVPQRVRVQHEARARHDVGPVARLVLLQQEESLVLLREEPVDRFLHLRLPAPLQTRHGAVPSHVIHRDEPPQRGVDAPQVPEVGVGAHAGRRTSGSARCAPAAAPAHRGLPPRRARAPPRRCRPSRARISRHRGRRCACSGAPRRVRRGVAARMPCGVRLCSSRRSDSGTAVFDQRAGRRSRRAAGISGRARPG